jgi:hypothetical protein
MNVDMLSSLNDKCMVMMSAGQRMADLVVANMESTAARSMDNMKCYADMCMPKAAAMGDLATAEGLRSAVETQGKAVVGLGQKMATDAQDMVQMGLDLMTEAQKVATDCANDLMAKPEPEATAG